MVSENSPKKITAVEFSSSQVFLEYIEKYGNDFSKFPGDYSIAFLSECYEAYIREKAKFVKRLGEESKISQISKIFRNTEGFSGLVTLKGSNPVQKVSELKENDFRMPFLLKDYELRLKQQLTYVNEMYEAMGSIGAITEDFNRDQIVREDFNRDQIVKEKNHEVEETCCDEDTSEIVVVPSQASVTDNQLPDDIDKEPLNNVETQPSKLADSQPPSLGDVHVSDDNQLSSTQPINDTDNHLASTQPVTVIEDRTSSTQSINDTGNQPQYTSNDAWTSPNRSSNDNNLQSLKVTNTSPDSSQSSAPTQSLNPEMLRQYTDFINEFNEQKTLDLNTSKRRNTLRITINNSARTHTNEESAPVKNEGPVTVENVCNVDDSAKEEEAIITGEPKNEKGIMNTVKYYLSKSRF